MYRILFFISKTSCSIFLLRFCSFFAYSSLVSGRGAVSVAAYTRVDWIVFAHDEIILIISIVKKIRPGRYGNNKLSKQQRELKTTNRTRIRYNNILESIQYEVVRYFFVFSRNFVISKFPSPLSDNFIRIWRKSYNRGWFLFNNNNLHIYYYSSVVVIISTLQQKLSSSVVSRLYYVRIAQSLIIRIKRVTREEKQNLRLTLLKSL